MTARRLLAALGIAALMLIFGHMLVSGPSGDLACRHVALTDSISGSLVEGVEDMALDEAADRLILSAYDRRTDEPGGLYAVPLDALIGGAGTLIAAQRLAPPPGAPPLRPHGFGLGRTEGGSAPLAVIARTRKAGGGTDGGLRAYALDRAGLAPAGPDIADPLLCNANDVAVDPAGGYLVTADRAACGGFGRAVEDVLALPRGRLIALRQGRARVLDEKIGFANGIAADERHVYLAATRAKALLVYDRARLEAGPVQRLRLGAAPDNLAFGDDGALYIAAHLSLLQFALFRIGLKKESPSAIYRYDPRAEPDARPTLLGRAKGRGAVSGATVALAARGHLVLGAAFEPGISVCSARSDP